MRPRSAGVIIYYVDRYTAGVAKLLIELPSLATNIPMPSARESS